MQTDDLQSLSDQARPLEKHSDMKPLIEHIKHARVVMIGEASHGTHEYYSWRDRLSRELIERHGYNFIAVEGDWPPCHKINQFIQTEYDLPSQSALKVFQRWPTWMWANTDVAKSIDWLKKWNLSRNEDEHVGFFGLDVYSLFESIDEVIRQVQKIEPKMVEHFRSLYGCFDPFMRDEKKYLRALLGMSESCQESVHEALMSLSQLRARMIEKTNAALFGAIQNATVVKDAEAYYRSMVFVDDQSWNIRDQHMMDTLQSLLNYYGPDSKGIVWAHNTHIGDYRATDMAAYGHINIGGLARERLGEENVALIGFGSFSGRVTASSAWGSTTDEMRLPPAKRDSYEDLFHRVADETPFNQFYFLMNRKMEGNLSLRRGHRAVGVVYNPMNERGNYVPTVLSKRYDAFIFIDSTTALNPLTTRLHREEMPETYPSGM